MARKHVGVAGIVGGCLALCTIGVVAANPLRLPVPVIRSWLLHEAPLGSDFSDVRAWLERRRWLDLGHHEQVGFPWEEPGQQYGIIGARSLGAHLGHYQGIPWRVDVEAFWAFDGDGRLVEVKVRKDADSL
jgi:hypothetical protein